MKVIQINASYKPAFIYGGPTMSVSKLSEVLVNNNINLSVLTTRANGSEELNVNLGKSILVDKVPVTYYKRITKDHTHFSPTLYYALNHQLSATARKADNIIVHIHTWWNLVSVISCLIAILKNTTVVLSPRGTLSSYSFGNRNNLIKNIIFRFSKPLFRRCHFHVTSENEKQAILSLVNPKSITNIPNLVSLPEVIPRHTTAKDEQEPLKLLFLSRIEQKKGLELLFEALKDLNLNYTLTIGGTGDQAYINSLQSHSKALEIDHKISWIGHQSSDKKFDLMAAHHLLVLPSYDENFANVVVESLASGTAVLVTENVGLSDYVKANEFGWVCKFDKEDLRNSLLQAGSDNQKLESIRNTAPEKIRRDFSDSEVCKQYIEMYKQALGR